MKNSLLVLLALFLASCARQKLPAKIISTEARTALSGMSTQPDKYSELFEKGIDFIASGNEPFWSLEINFDKTIHFKNVGGSGIETPAVLGIKAMDADVTRYAAESEKGSLIVQIMRRECINSMSGEKLTYAVTVEAKNNTDAEAVRYKGCGQYLYDYRINDIWVLESVNDTKLIPANFKKGLPLLEINIAQQKVFGHTGCNNINTSLQMMGKKISFGHITSTRTACNNIAFENKYLGSLSNHTIPYFIKPGKLRLQVTTDSAFIYKKID